MAAWFASGVIDGGHEAAGRLIGAEPWVEAGVAEPHQAFFSAALQRGPFAWLTQTRFWEIFWDFWGLLGLTKNRDVVKNVRLVERE
jgi:hypothetical protein